MKKVLINFFILFTLLHTSMYGDDISQKAELVSEANIEAVEIEPSKLKEMLEDGENVVVLDVRETDQRGEGRIPTHEKYELTLGQLEFEISNLVKEKNRVIVTFCKDGIESALAAQTLRHLGYINATNLKGGLKAWAKAGFPVKTGLGLIKISEEEF